MTAASEQETQRFLQEYDLVLLPGIPCFQEKLRACLIIFERTGELPRIYQKNIPGGNHSYLVHRGVVYNQFDANSVGVTPDCSLDELQGDSIDFTAYLFLGAYSVSIGNFEDDIFGIRELEETLIADLTGYDAAMQRLESAGEERVDRHTYYEHMLMLAIETLEEADSV